MRRVDSHEPEESNICYGNKRVNLLWVQRLGALRAGVGLHALSHMHYIHDWCLRRMVV